MRFDGKVALITGGGRGIGLAIAERFAAEGALVMIADRDESLAEHAVGSMATKNVAGIRADIAIESDVQNAIEQTVKRFGRLDFLINNAGIDFVGSVDETSYDDWRRMFSVDLDGAFLCIKYARPHLARYGEGAVINIGSIHATQTQRGRAAYAAAKAGLLGLTRALALDLGPQGIRINTIAPGYIRTSIWSVWLDRLPDPERVLRNIAAQHPLRRLGKPEDVAGVAAFLASPDAAFISGTVITVDGGLTAMFAPPPATD